MYYSTRARTSPPPRQSNPEQATKKCRHTHLGHIHRPPPPPRAGSLWATAATRAGPGSRAGRPRPSGCCCAAARAAAAACSRSALRTEGRARGQGAQPAALQASLNDGSRQRAACGSSGALTQPPHCGRRAHRPHRPPPLQARLRGQPGPARTHGTQEMELSMGGCPAGASGASKLPQPAARIGKDVLQKYPTSQRRLSPRGPRPPRRTHAGSAGPALASGRPLGALKDGPRSGRATGRPSRIALSSSSPRSCCSTSCTRAGRPAAQRESGSGFCCRLAHRAASPALLPHSEQREARRCSHARRAPCACCCLSATACAAWPSPPPCPAPGAREKGQLERAAGRLCRSWGRQRKEGEQRASRCRSCGHAPTHPRRRP